MDDRHVAAAATIDGNGLGIQDRHHIARAHQRRLIRPELHLVQPCFLRRASCSLDHRGRHIQTDHVAAVTNAPHMHLYIVYPMLLLFCTVFLALGIRGFKQRVLA